MLLLYAMGGQFVKSHSKSHRGVKGNFGTIHKTGIPPLSENLCKFDTFWNTEFAPYMSQYTAQGAVYCPPAVFCPSGVDSEPLSMWLCGLIRGTPPEGSALGKSLPHGLLTVNPQDE